MVDPDFAGDPLAGKLYVDPPGLRIEQTIADEPTILLFDTQRGFMVWLDPMEKSYVEMEMEEADRDWSAWLFLTEENPCGAADYEEVKASKLGRETLIGRKVDKWRCEFADSDDDDLVWTVWSDPSLPVPLRIEDNTGFVFEVVRFEAASQPAALFQVPAGYQKIDHSEDSAIELRIDD